MSRRYQFWTPEQQAEVLALREKGVSFPKIGERFGRSGRSVQSLCERLSGKFNRLGRTCSDCPTPISDSNRRGYCKSCNTRRLNADKEFSDKRLEALNAVRPALKGALHIRKAALAAAQKRLANPGYREWLTNQMRTVVAPKSRTPESIAKRNTPEMARKISEHQMSWCPEAYRQLYRELRRKQIRAADAREAVFAQIKADEARLSPFERQMRALERGAKLVANTNQPTFGQAVDHGERKWGVR